MAVHRRLTIFLLICLINESTAGGTDVERQLVETLMQGIQESAKAVHRNLLTSLTMNIDNLTKYRLVNYEGIVLTGKMENPKMHIEPKASESFKVARSGTVKFLMGNSGIVSWQIEGTNTRLVVMWRLNAIKRKEKDKNTLWVALTPSQSFNLDEWKKYVVSNAEVPSTLNCKKGIFSQNMKINTLLSETNEFTAEGIMGTGKNPTVSIKLSQTETMIRRVKTAKFF